MSHLTGKKVTLFPFNYKIDFQYFMELYKNGNRINLPVLSCCKDEQDLALSLGSLVKAKRIVMFVATRRFGDELKRLGMVLLIREADYKISMVNLTDEYVLKGLSKRFKNNDLTYSEDIINTIVDYCFENESIKRISISIPVREKLQIRLLKKVGFEKDGVLRKYVKIDNDFYDIALLSKIKGGL